jgi:hypothetical protein
VADGQPNVSHFRWCGVTNSASLVDRDVFLTVDDIRDLDEMKDQVLMVFKAPPGTQMELSEIGQHLEKRYRIGMKSVGGPIGVWVINESPAQGQLNVDPSFLTAESNIFLEGDTYLTDPDLFFNDDDFPGLSEYYDTELYPPS